MIKGSIPKLIRIAPSKKTGVALENKLPLERIPKINTVDNGKESARIFTAKLELNVRLLLAILFSWASTSAICENGQKLQF
ncbi:hypothetical protein [Maribacter sp. 4U21]|uniref:hypothetical protein n=1 Tax=Maribacter sp. 4U21 TaxID=1889779 RepID=UPI00211EDBB5|nr:hypothetical protein [Maribacter sp. 4U21]